MKLLDLTIVRRPAEFDNVEAYWPDWKLKAQSWLFLIQTEYGAWLDKAENSQVEVPI